MRIASVTRGLALGATTSVVAVLSASWAAPTYATTTTAGTQTIVGQGAYTCESKPNGLPYEIYNVTLRMTLSAPASVTPGQTVSLSGTAALQFPEKAYQEGKQIGESEADGYSDTLSVGSTMGGRTTDVAANRWQTAPFPWGDPVVISAPITIHSFTVPTNASGALTITLPRNQRAAPNTASNSPATVAFNGVANNRTAVGNIPENLACYLQGTAPSVIGTIPITTSVAAARTASRSGAGATVSAGGAASAASKPPAAPSGSNAASAGSGAASAAGLPQQAPTGTGEVGQSATTNGASNASLAPTGSMAPQTRSGVFISTNVLILLGAAVCVAALAYALLMRYRLKSIRQAMDGQ